MTEKNSTTTHSLPTAMLSKSSPQLFAQLDDVRCHADSVPRANQPAPNHGPTEALRLRSRARLGAGTAVLVGERSGRLPFAVAGLVALSLLCLALYGCSTIDRVAVTAGQTEHGATGAVQIYFRDAAGQLLTTRLPKALIDRTISVPVGSDLDRPTGETVPTIPRCCGAKPPTN